MMQGVRWPTRNCSRMWLQDERPLELRSRENMFRDEIRGVMSGARDEESRRIHLLKEQHFALMPDA